MITSGSAGLAHIGVLVSAVNFRLFRKNERLGRHIRLANPDLA